MRPLIPFVLALLVAASAQAELRRCTDEAGHITITDMPCETPQALDDSATDDTQRPAPGPATAALPLHTTQLPKLQPSGAVPPSSRFTTPANAKSFHVDTNTLRAAHEAMLLADSTRQHIRLASR